MPPQALPPLPEKLDSPEDADCVLRHMAHRRARISKAELTGTEKKARIDQATAAAKKNDADALEKLEVLYAPQLKEFAAMDRARWGKKSSLKLAFGKLGFRVVAGKIVIDDNPRAVSLGQALDADRYIAPASIKESEVKSDLHDPDRAKLWEKIAHIGDAGEKFFYETIAT